MLSTGAKRARTVPASHRLPYHCLDVAACGLTLLRRLPHWRTRLEAIGGLAGDELETAVQVLFALHDLGKFATAFQNLRPDLLRRLQGRTSAKGYATRHDTLGWTGQATNGKGDPVTLHYDAREGLRWA